MPAMTVLHDVYKTPDLVRVNKGDDQVWMREAPVDIHRMVGGTDIHPLKACNYLGRPGNVIPTVWPHSKRGLT